MGDDPYESPKGEIESSSEEVIAKRSLLAVIVSTLLFSGVYVYSHKYINSIAFYLSSQEHYGLITFIMFFLYIIIVVWFNRRANLIGMVSLCFVYMTSFYLFTITRDYILHDYPYELSTHEWQSILKGLVIAIVLIPYTVSVKWIFNKLFPLEAK